MTTISTDIWTIYYFGCIKLLCTAVVYSTVSLLWHLSVHLYSSCMCVYYRPVCLEQIKTVKHCISPMGLIKSKLNEWWNSVISIYNSIPLKAKYRKHVKLFSSWGAVYFNASNPWIQKASNWFTFYIISHVLAKNVICSMLSMGHKESWGIIMYGFYVKKKKN